MGYIESELGPWPLLYENLKVVVFDVFHYIILYKITLICFRVDGGECSVCAMLSKMSLSRRRVQ